MQSYHVCHNRLLANEGESIYGHLDITETVDLTRSFGQ